MTKTISKIGNSQGIIFDAALMDLARLKVGDQVNVTVMPDSGAIVLMPAIRHSPFVIRHSAFACRAVALAKAGHSAFAIRAPRPQTLRTILIRQRTRFASPARFTYMIKNKLLLVATIAASILLPAAARAQSFSIEIGDRPYYSHGPRYWAGDYEMVWVAGHRSGRHWVHGHYVRGEHRRHDRERHHHDDRHDYRESDRH